MKEDDKDIKGSWKVL